MYGWYPDKWWTAEQHLDGCSDEEREYFLKESRVLMLDLLGRHNDTNQSTPPGLVSIKMMLFLSVSL